MQYSYIIFNSTINLVTEDIIDLSLSFLFFLFLTKFFVFICILFLFSYCFFTDGATKYFTLTAGSTVGNVDVTFTSDDPYDVILPTTQHFLVIAQSIFLFSNGLTLLSAGDSTTFNVVPQLQPINGGNITLSLSSSGLALVSPTVFSWSAATWQTVQSFTVHSSLHLENITINFALSGSDYDEYADPAPLTIQVTQAISISPLPSFLYYSASSSVITLSTAQFYYTGQQFTVTVVPSGDVISIFICF